MLAREVLSYYAYNPKGLAEYFVRLYFGDRDVVYPINPFEMLAEYGVRFVFRPFDGFEGVFLPAVDGRDVNLVAFNSRRPITRQRYTAAHELCHLLKDVGDAVGNIVCASRSRTPIERYAEEFACALLMPHDEVLLQVAAIGDNTSTLTLDDILRLSYYFGVSFEACYYRVRELVAYRTPRWNKADGLYRPVKRAECLGLSHDGLKMEMLDAWQDVRFRFASSFALQVFRTQYVYNDSRLEGLTLSHEAAAEIVTDLLNNTQHSSYCNERSEAFCNVAGHVRMYDLVFETHITDEPLTIWKLFDLNKTLFSCAPYPDYGGRVRTANPMVLGSKFETLDSAEVFPALLQLQDEINALEKNWINMRRSEIVERIAKIHHRITVIHPFPDGNGRSSRAFASLMLLRYGLVPIYVKVGDKGKYISALEAADRDNNIEPLCIFIIDRMVEAHQELSSRICA